MSSLNPNKYNFPFRTNFELGIIFIWFFIAIVSALMPQMLDVPAKPYYIFAALSGVLGLMLGGYGFEIYVRKKRLKGYELEFVDANSDYMLKKFGVSDEVRERVKENRK